MGVTMTFWEHLFLNVVRVTNLKDSRKQIPQQKAFAFNPFFSLQEDGFRLLDGMATFWKCRIAILISISWIKCSSILKSHTSMNGTIRVQFTLLGSICKSLCFVSKWTGFNSLASVRLLLRHKHFAPLNCYCWREFPNRRESEFEETSYPATDKNKWTPSRLACMLWRPLHLHWLLLITKCMKMALWKALINSSILDERITARFILVQTQQNSSTWIAYWRWTIEAINYR